MVNPISNRVLLLTGLSGAGKSTIANQLISAAQYVKSETVLLDGDVLRARVFPQFGFSDEERTQYFSRVSALLELLDGVSVIVCFVCPKNEYRKILRRSNRKLFEIYLSTPLEVCQSRHKGPVYSGLCEHVAGVDVAYEAPKEPDLVLDTSILTTEECVKAILDEL